MIEITVPEQNKKMIEQVKQAVVASRKGLVVIASSDQNWNQYLVVSILGALSEALALQDGMEKIVAIGDPEDQYAYDWMKHVSPEDAGSSEIVLAGNLRDIQKIQDALMVAKTSIVVGVMHVHDAQSVIERCKDFGADEKDVVENVAVVIQQEQ